MTIRIPPQSVLFVSLLVSALLPAQAVATLDDVTGQPEAGAAVLDEATAAAIRREGIENSQVMRILRDLTGQIGHRLTGSDNFTKACAWAAVEFQGMGVPSVTMEKWGEWRLAWNRGAWKGRITSPVAMDLYVATDAWTAGTGGPRQGTL